MLKSKGPALYFCFLVAMAHLVLPALDRENLGPFFVWRLYHQLRHGDTYDLKLRTSGGERFLSEHPEGMSRLPVKQIILWNRVCGYNPETKEDTKIFVDQVNGMLEEDNMQVEHICRTATELAAYMLMTTEQKRKICEDVYP
jgi:hypothetical protein